MNKYEKDILRLLEAHASIDKQDLIRNINRAVRSKGIYRKGKNLWISKVTGSPIGTVDTWFSRAKCRTLNKIPLYAMCQIAVALKVSVWDFLDTEEKEQETDRPQIDRRSSLYWHIRRKEAENIWNGSHAQEKGTWGEQDKAVQREFLDRLYLERLEANKEFFPDYFKDENKFCRALFIKKYPSSLSDRFLNEITYLPVHSITSIDVVPIPKDMTTKILQKKYLGIESDIIKQQRVRNKNNDLSSEISYNKRIEKKEIEGCEGKRPVPFLCGCYHYPYGRHQRGA